MIGSALRLHVTSRRQRKSQSPCTQLRHNLSDWEIYKVEHSPVESCFLHFPEIAMQEETYDWDVAWLEALDSLTSQDLPMLHASDSFIKSFPADGPTMPTNVAMPLSDRDRAVSADTAAASDAAQSLPRDTAATLDTPLSLIQTVVSSEISAVTHESEAVSCHDASLQSPESQGGLAWNAENQKTNLDPAIAGVSLISLQPNSMEAQGGADAQPKEAHCTLGTFSSSNDNAKELQHLAAIPPESDIHGLPTDCSTTGGRLAGAESLSAGNLIADTAAAICDVGTTEAESPPTEITSADTAAAGCDAETAGAESPPAANVGASDATAAYSDTKMVEAGSRPTENASASKAVAASNDAEMAKAGYPLARHTSVNETVAALEMAEAEHQPTASTSPNQVVGKVMEKPRITCIDNSAVSAKVSVPRTGSKPEQEFHIGINLRSTKCLENKMKRGSRGELVRFIID